MNNSGINRHTSLFRPLLFAAAAALAVAGQAPAGTQRTERLAGDERDDLNPMHGLFPRPFMYARSAELAYGRHYGFVRREEMADPDVVHTPVGSFHLGRLGERIPAELLGDARPAPAGQRFRPEGVYLFEPREAGAPGREALERLGVKILDFIPNNVFVGRVPPGRSAQVERSSDIVTVVEYPAALKRGPMVGQLALPSKAMAKSGTYFLAVVLFEGVDPGPVMRLLENERARVRAAVNGYGDGLRLLVDVDNRGTLARLERMPEVRFFEDWPAAGYVPL